MRAHLIGITGCSCSGKTTLTEALAAELSALVVPTDCYYKGLEELDLESRKACNFDDPEMLDWPLLVSHVNALYQGRPIRRPTYCFASYSRLPQTILVRPARFVVVEGIFALHSEELRRFFSAKLFVDAPDEVCLSRRLRRDTLERGRTPESIQRQYETTVRPAAERFILPTKANASLTLNGTAPIAQSLEAVLNLIRQSASARFSAPTQSAA